MLVWFATLVAMAEGLGDVGFLVWFGSRASTYMTRIPLVPMLIAAVAVFFIIHYLFASITAQATALAAGFPAGCSVDAGRSGQSCDPSSGLLAGLDGRSYSLREWSGAYLV